MDFHFDLVEVSRAYKPHQIYALTASVRKLTSSLTFSNFNFRARAAKMHLLGGDTWSTGLRPCKGPVLFTELVLFFLAI